MLEKYSSLTRLLRVTAICQRAVARFRRIVQSASSPLTSTELQLSNNFWVQQLQSSYFANEIEIISKGVPLPKSNPLTRLTPFIDQHEILRVGGRLQNSKLDPEAKYLVILLRASSYISLVINDAHLRTLHGGTQLTLAYIRQTFWIIGGRAPIRSHVFRCVRCTRYRGLRAQQLMGQLPTSRVNPSSPFFYSGIDYAGPVSLKTWRERAAKVYKGYLAIFICFSTSAVHLEIVTDY